MLLLAVTLALLVGWFLNRTRSGRALRAGAQDAEMAQLCGVNRDGTIRLAFAIGGALAGASAFIFTIYYSHPFTEHGAESGLFAFTAAVLGGIGRPRGAFLSGLLLGVLAAFSDFFISSQWTPVVVLLVLIALLALRPTGLNGEDRDEEQLAIERRGGRAADRWPRLAHRWAAWAGADLPRARSGAGPASPAGRDQHAAVCAAGAGPEYCAWLRRAARFGLCRMFCAGWLHGGDNDRRAR